MNTISWINNDYRRSSSCSKSRCITARDTAILLLFFSTLSRISVTFLGPFPKELKFPFSVSDFDPSRVAKKDVKQRWPLDSSDARLASFCRLAALSNFFVISRADRDGRAAQCADSRPGRTAGGWRAIAQEALETTVCDH